MGEIKNNINIHKFVGVNTFCHKFQEPFRSIVMTQHVTQCTVNSCVSHTLLSHYYQCCTRPLRGVGASPAGPVATKPIFRAKKILSEHAIQLRLYSQSRLTTCTCCGISLQTGWDKQRCLLISSLVIKKHLIHLSTRHDKPSHKLCYMLCMYVLVCVCAG